MSKSIAKNLANAAPKTLTTILLATTLISCEPAERQMAYTTTAEREEYEMYGISPEDIKKQKSGHNKQKIAGIILGCSAIISGVATIVLSSKNINKNKQR